MTIILSVVASDCRVRGGKAHQGGALTRWQQLRRVASGGGACIQSWRSRRGVQRPQLADKIHGKFTWLSETDKTTFSIPTLRNAGTARLTAQNIFAARSIPSSVLRLWDKDAIIHWCHAFLPGFSGHYQDLGSQAKNGIIWATILFLA